MNLYWRSRPVKIDRLRCFAAYAMRTAGGTYAEIAEILGVSVPTASDYVAYGEKWYAEEVA